jgi:hypothetical protein
VGLEETGVKRDLLLCMIEFEKHVSYHIQIDRIFLVVDRKHEKKKILIIYESLSSSFGSQNVVQLLQAKLLYL